MHYILTSYIYLLVGYFSDGGHVRNRDSWLSEVGTKRFRETVIDCSFGTKSLCLEGKTKRWTTGVQGSETG